MCIIDVNLLILLEELADTGKDQAKLIVLRRHRVNGDNGVVFMLPGRFPVKCDPATSRPIPPVVDLEVSDEKRSWVHRKVGHDAAGSDRDAVGRRGAGGVFLSGVSGVFGEGRRRLGLRMRMNKQMLLFLVKGRRRAQGSSAGIEDVCWFSENNFWNPN